MKQISLILLLALCLISCVKNNDNPAWINLSNWELKANPVLNGQEGELTLNFTDVYLLVDGEVMGFFELPIKLPLLKQGNHKITMYPAIRNNGISATKRVYPFTEPMELTLDLQPDKTFDISPSTHYSSSCKFWIEDFEDAALKIYTETSISKGKLTAGNDPNILQWGNFYGHVSVNTVDTSWFGYTTPAMTLPQGGAEVFLEIDYINNNSLLTGLLAYTNTTTINNPNISLNRQNQSEMKWKKIYIDLRELVSYSTSANSFAHYFRARHDSGTTNGDVYLDNIKVIHF